MTGGVDLHVHTTASDGQLSPTSVIRKAQALGLATIAITDHDTTEGIEEALAAARGSGLQVIPGVEISTDIPGAEVHILGYYVAYGDPFLREKLSLFRDSRLGRAQRMVAKLARLGVSLEWKRVQEIANGAAVGRPHVARAMLEKGYVSSIHEAFDLYIGRNGPAYEDRFKLSPAEAVRMILMANGLPVLAHPLQVHHSVPELCAAGLVGLEAYYTGYAPDETDFLLSLAARHGLLATGGSDFHGEDGWPENKLGALAIPPHVVDSLRARHERTRAPSSGSSLQPNTNYY